jgi:hypothetical protein
MMPALLVLAAFPTYIYLTQAPTSEPSRPLLRAARHSLRRHRSVVRPTTRNSSGWIVRSVRPRSSSFRRKARAFDRVGEAFMPIDPPANPSPARVAHEGRPVQAWFVECVP